MERPDTGLLRPPGPDAYDPDLTEQLLEEGGKRLYESRKVLDELDAVLDDREG